MSWIDQVTRDFIITTGDGAEYKPDWLNAKKQKEYNIAEFLAPDLPGSLVIKAQPKGRKYSIEIYFQGENHIQDTDRFEASADDTRPWLIDHPVYGRIIVHPTSLEFDNTQYGVSKITGIIIETLTEETPKASISAIEKINADKTELDVLLNDVFTGEIDATQTTELITSTEGLFNIGAKLKLPLEEAEEYFNLFNTASSVVNNATVAPLEAIRALQAMIAYPSLTATRAAERINLLRSQFEELSSAISTVSGKSSKEVFEINAGQLIASAALSAATPLEEDYSTRNEVEGIIEEVIDLYNAYTDKVDELQSEDATAPDSFTANFDVQYQVGQLVHFTLSSLFSIAIDARQERIYTVPEDTNPVILAHQLYGIKEGVDSIEFLIETNDIKMDDLLNIEKGTKISYFV